MDPHRLKLAIDFEQIVKSRATLALECRTAIGRFPEKCLLFVPRMRGGREQKADRWQEICAAIGNGGLLPPSLPDSGLLAWDGTRFVRLESNYTIRSFLASSLSPVASPLIWRHQICSHFGIEPDDHISRGDSAIWFIRFVPLLPAVFLMQNSDGGWASAGVVAGLVFSYILACGNLILKRYGPPTPRVGKRGRDWLWRMRGWLCRCPNIMLFLTASVIFLPYILTARPWAPDPVAQESPRRRPMIGIQMEISDSRDGVIVKHVLPGSPAESKLKPGDRVIAINGVETDWPSQFSDEMRREPARFGVSIWVVRDGEQREFFMFPSEAPFEPEPDHPPPQR